MNEETKLSLVPFSPKRPDLRQPDPRDQIIVNQHRLALLADKKIELWEFWGEHMANMLTLALLLADAERWDELRDFLKTAEGQAKQMAAPKCPTACDLPPGLDGGAA